MPSDVVGAKLAVLLVWVGCTGIAVAATPAHIVHLGPQSGPLCLADTPAVTAPVPDADVTPAAGLSLEPAQQCRWVFSPGDDLVLTATVAAGEATDTTRLTFWNWRLQPLAQVAVPTGESQVQVAVAGRGTYLVTLDRFRRGDCVARLARSFAVCPDNNHRRKDWARSGFWVGQCSFPGWQHARLEGGHTARPEGFTDEQSRELDAELVARMGVQVARINLPVTRRDETGLDLDFTLADACARTFADRGLALDVQLFAPEGAGRGPVLPAYAEAPVQWAMLYPLQEQPYRHYVREMARRYGRDARFFQIGNEPGNPQQSRGTAGEFVSTVRQAADELRRQFPRTPVTNGGYCSDNEVVQEIVAGLPGVTDFASYHYHARLEGLKPFRERMAQLHRQAGYEPVRLANTEMGYAMPTLAAERVHAVQELQKLLYCWAHGDEGVLLYSSRELWWPRQFSYSGISDYGFVDHFFCPRFAYGAVSALLDHYAGYRFECILVEGERLHAYAFAAGSRRLVTLFAPRGETRARVHSNAAAASRIDAMGNVRPLRAARQVTLTVDEYPVTVQLEGATEVQALELPARSAAPKE